MRREKRDGARGEDYEELDRFLEEAAYSLESGDLHGADGALKKAGLKAASIWGEAGQPRLPGHVGDLVRLVGEVQELLLHRRRPAGPAEGLLESLGEVRRRFDHEAPGEIPANEASALPE